MKNESGSVLLYILIAIVLFAALSFAVSQMGRGGGGESNKELRRLQASEIMQYTRALQSAIQSMTIDGTEDTQISFENTTIAGYNYASCGDACKVFSPGGGAMAYMIPAAGDWLDAAQSAGANFGQWVFSGSNSVVNVGTAAPDLLAILPWVRKDLCMEINTLLGIANPGLQPPNDSGDADLATKFQGTYTATQSIGGGDPDIEGQRAGCFQGATNLTSPPAETYHFFQVLVAR